jgi:hypothetical protein
MKYDILQLHHLLRDKIHLHLLHQLLLNNQHQMLAQQLNFR